MGCERNYFGDSMSGATFSPCRTWRYALWRRWADPRIVDIDGADIGPDFHRHCAFIGLNPSKADETLDDPTIRRCVGFAKSWGFDGLFMLNLFAFRATNPLDMKREADPIGPENDECLRRAVGLFGRVVAAWGVHGAFRNRSTAIRGSIHPHQLHHLGLTAGGEPKHPLYLRADTQPVRWE